jgi:hypothetical protein
MRRRNSSTKDLRGAGTEFSGGTGSLKYNLGSTGCDDPCGSGKTGGPRPRSPRTGESVKPHSAASSFSLVRCRLCLRCATDWLSVRHLGLLGELARQLTGVLASMRCGSERRRVADQESLFASSSASRIGYRRICQSLPPNSFVLLARWHTPFVRA